MANLILLFWQYYICTILFRVFWKCWLLFTVFFILQMSNHSYNSWCSCQVWGLFRNMIFRHIRVHSALSTYVFLTAFLFCFHNQKNTKCFTYHLHHSHKSWPLLIEMPFSMNATSFMTSLITDDSSSFLEFLTLFLHRITTHNVLTIYNKYIIYNKFYQHCCFLLPKIKLLNKPHSRQDCQLSCLHICQINSIENYGWSFEIAQSIRLL